MTLQLERKVFTIEEYYRLAEVGILTESDHVELINGDIIAMNPINSPHAGMVNRLASILDRKLHKRATITVQNPIRISTISEPEPDVVIAKYDVDYYESHHPTSGEIYVVIEVSDTTLEKDREVKHPLYAEVSIPEYWIINIQDRQIEIHRQPKDGVYQHRQIISEEANIECKAIEFVLPYYEIFK